MKSALKNLWKLFLINSQWFVYVCVFVFYNYFAASIVVVGLYTELAALAAFVFLRFAKCYWPKLRKSTRKSTKKKNKIKEEKTRKSNEHMLVKSHCKYNFWESYIIMYSIAEWKLSQWNSRNISLVIYYAGHIIHYVGLYIYPMSIYINWWDPNWGHFPGKCVRWKKKHLSIDP